MDTEKLPKNSQNYFRKDKKLQKIILQQRLLVPNSFLPQICQERSLIYTTFLVSQGRNGKSEMYQDHGLRLMKIEGNETYWKTSTVGNETWLGYHSKAKHFATELCHYF